jgi:hypothetical protein
MVLINFLRCELFLAAVAFAPLGPILILFTLHPISLQCFLKSIGAFRRERDAAEDEN